MKKVRGKKQDFWEKSWVSAQYKAVDVARPLLELWRRVDKNDPNYRFVDSAVRLWGVAFNDMTKQRRYNVIRQTDSEYVSMLSDPKAFAEREVKHLFGDRFIKALSKEAERDAAFKKIERQSGSSSSSRRFHPYNNKRGERSGGSSRGQNNSQQSGYNSGGASTSFGAGNYRGGSNRGGGNRYDTLTTSPPVIPDSLVGGRLMFYARAWERITNDPWVLETIRFGVDIDFISKPIQGEIPPQLALSKDMSAICDKEVDELLSKGAVSLVSDDRVDAFYSNLFVVPKRPTGYRPVINLRGVNKFVRYEHFKMEGIEAVKQLIRSGDWFVKLDLKDAYFAVPMREDHKHLLRFCWAGRRLQFECLPFGLAPAPRFFTKLLKPVVAFLRQLGIRLVLYLDDMLIMNESREGALNDLRTAVSLLVELGFLIKWEKSVTDLVQVIEFLGLTFDSVNGLLTLPERKTSEVISLCKRALAAPLVKLRDVSSIMGHFAWAIPTVPFAQVHYRCLQRFYISQTRRCDGDLSVRVALPDDARADLLWWRDAISRAGGKPFILSEPDLVLYSDASLTGWGGHCNGIRTRGPWTSAESSYHINELEVLAAFNVLRTFTRDSKGIYVEIFMDNFTAVCYVNKGGGTASKRMTEITSCLFAWCEVRQISIRAHFLPGRENIIADEESRNLPDSSDWQLCPDLFKLLQQIWRMDIDLFASSWNTQLPRFVSWFPQPEAMFINAFSVGWNGLKAYIFPPFSLIARCLSKIRRERAEVIFVCPYWPSRPYFPLLLELCCDIPRILPQRPDLLLDSVGFPHSMVSDNSLLLIALKLSGDSSVTEGFRATWSHCSWRVTVKPHQLRTSPPGTIGVLGALKGIRIPCVQM